MTELKKDVARIIDIVKNEGVKERVFSAKSSWYEWSKEERDLKAKIENVRERKLMTLFFDLEESLQRVPSQSEYLKEYMKIALETNENLKKMVAYMRKGNYEKAFEILKNDHFGTGRNTALKMH